MIFRFVMFRTLHPFDVPHSFRTRADVIKSGILGCPEMGLVTNLVTARIKAQHDRSLCSNLHNLVPPAKRFIPAFAMFACGDQMAAGVEGVVYGCMDGDKSLCRAGRSEALHLSFSSSDRNVGAFNPIILPLGSMMPSREAELSNGSSVGSQLVRDQRARCKAMSLDKLPHQLQGCAPIAFRLDQDIQHLAVPIDRAPRVHAPAANRHEHLVEMPLKVRLRT